MNLLPHPPKASAEDTALTHGLKLFMFVLQTRVTATLSLSELALAEHASVSAVAGKFELGSTYAALADTTRLIAGAKRARWAILQSIEDSVNSANTDVAPEPEPEAKLSDAELVLQAFKGLLALVNGAGGIQGPPAGGSRVPVHPRPSGPSSGASADRLQDDIEF